MAANDNSDNNELKKRFDTFLHETRYQEKPYRLLGKPQIANRQLSVLIGYPTLETGGKPAFAELVSGQLREYGLEAAEPAHQKAGMRVQARLLVPETSEEPSKE